MSSLPTNVEHLPISQLLKLRGTIQYKIVSIENQIRNLPFNPATGLTRRSLHESLKPVRSELEQIQKLIESKEQLF